MFISRIIQCCRLFYYCAKCEENMFEEMMMLLIYYLNDFFFNSSKERFLKQRGEVKLIKSIEAIFSR